MSHTLAIAIGAAVGAWGGAPWGVAVIVPLAVLGALSGHYFWLGLRARSLAQGLRTQLLAVHQVACETSAQQLMALAQAHRPAGVPRRAIEDVELESLLTTYYCALVVSGALTDEARRARIKEAAITRAITRLMGQEATP